MKILPLFLTFIFLAQFTVIAQSTLKVLFLGNSYTSVNNLPDLTFQVAKSAGDSLVFSSNCPGGYTFNQHSTNATSISLIQQGGWDYVVLQEQSQLPSFTDPEVQSMVFPYATTLDNMIHAADSCTETIFYMTWGRKNGDASNCAVWPPVCTYEGMDSLLHLRYMMMAQDNNAEVSPVGAVWHYLRLNAPGIELYSADESHPSPAGSYAAACTFYTSMFRKSPVNITYDYTLSASDAAIIRNAVKAVVFDSLTHWYNVNEVPHASFMADDLGFQVSFTNTSVNANHLNWSFGDGATSTEQNPVHTYATTANYTVSLIAEYCGIYDTTSQILAVGPLGIDSFSETVYLFPNPFENTLSILADAEIVSVTISDASGRIVAAKDRIGSRQTDVELSLLDSGIYFICVETLDGYALRKIVKNSN